MSVLTSYKARHAGERVPADRPRKRGRHVHTGLFSGWGGMAGALIAYRRHPILRADVPFSADLLPFVRASDIQQGDAPR